MWIKPRRILLARVVALFALAGAWTACDRQFPSEPGEFRETTQLGLSTSGGATALPADGVSTLEIVAQVPPEAIKPNRQVRFRTTSGSFAGASTPTQIDASFDSDGRSSAVLRSSTTVGPVEVNAQVIEGMSALTVVARLLLAFVAPDDSAFRFVDAPRTAPADGASVSRITVLLPSGLALDQRTVTFRTTLGSFDGASEKLRSVNAGADGRASVLLYSPKEAGLAQVSASVSVYHVDTFVTFVPARAEIILVEIPARLAQNSSFIVKATLIRSVGVPTIGTVARMRATDSTGAVFGSFRNVTRSDTSGVITAEFHPEGTGTIGRSRIEVTAEGSDALGQAEFELVGPAQ